ncbi:hypothetical protein WMF30_19035 [Sorangium sp. So ce134]
MPATALIDPTVHPTAEEFYARCPDEAIGATGTMHIDDRVPVPGMTLESLLTSMESLAGGSEALIVHHGTPEGMSLLLVPGARPLRPARGRQEARHVLANAMVMSILADAPGSGALLPISDAEASSRLNIDAGKVAELRGRMARVQRLRLAHVAIRACNIGQSSTAMESIKRFFGALRLSAPDQPDAHGSAGVAPTTDARAWARWTRAHPRGRIYDDPALGGRFALSADRAQRRFHLLADSDAVVERWLGAHLPPGAWQGTPSRFLWHALWAQRSVPTFSGEPEYRRHIITA